MTHFRADMHCHSSCSDGSLTPTELVSLASERGLNALSITDHDTIAAYQTALPAAKECGLELVSGVEFSTLFGEASIHILGYAFSLEDPIINTFCEKHRQRRDSRNRAILELLAKKGMPIAEEELFQLVSHDKNSSLNHMICRPHIAKLMVNKGYVSDIREAFNKYIGEGCSCYAKGDFFSPEETIDVIQKSKGFAFIAHPHLIEDPSVLVRLLRLNFDGIECYYSRFPPSAHTRWVKIAEQRGWLISGGSDFHGEIKPQVSLGCSWVNEEHYNIIRARFIENNG
jgi:predicted metal-dependent phosphoesterase TrpH